MDTQTREALEGSIRKWERIAAGQDIDKGSANCPLCQIFNTNGNNCAGCPVAIHTGMAHCRNTPYVTFKLWETSNLEYRETLDPERHSNGIALAQKELDFLRSLRPSPPME